MASPEKIIKDIRYFESTVENVAGNPLPHYIGSVFSFNGKKMDAISDRIARKLNEYDFVSGAFDHIYINYTTCLPDGEIKSSNRIVEKWFRYIDVGLSVDRINKMTEDQKEEFIIQSTFKCLEHLYKDDKRKINTIRKVEADVRKFGSQLEINYLVKETRPYLIKIYYKIKPGSDSSYAFVEYNDKKDGLKKRTSIELQFYDDIYLLIDRISVKERKIVLNPKTSFRADLYNKRYTIPISIDISKMTVI